VHAKVPQVAEVLLVDASGDMDRQKYRVTPTAAGGWPKCDETATAEYQRL